jgi:hypothetical protein
MVAVSLATSAVPHSIEVSPSIADIASRTVGNFLLPIGYTRSMFARSSGVSCDPNVVVRYVVRFV